MIVMALDHVRDFIHRGAMSQSPTDLATTTPLLFMTRWVTHFCAPVFMLTAGLGAYFYWQGTIRLKPDPQDKSAAVEVPRHARPVADRCSKLTVMQLAYNFDISSELSDLPAGAVGARRLHDRRSRGWCGCRSRVLSALSVATIVLHHLADGVRAQRMGRAVLDPDPPGRRLPVRRPRLHHPLSTGAVGCGDGAWLLPWAGVLGDAGRPASDSCCRAGIAITIAFLRGPRR